MAACAVGKLYRQNLQCYRRGTAFVATLFGGISSEGRGALPRHEGGTLAVAQTSSAVGKTVAKGTVDFGGSKRRRWCADLLLE